MFASDPHSCQISALISQEREAVNFRHLWLPGCKNSIISIHGTVHDPHLLTQTPDLLLPDTCNTQTLQQCHQIGLVHSPSQSYNEAVDFNCRSCNTRYIKINCILHTTTDRRYRHSNIEISTNNNNISRTTEKLQKNVQLSHLFKEWKWLQSCQNGHKGHRSRWAS